MSPTYLSRPESFEARDITVSIVGAGYVGVTLASIMADSDLSKVYLLDKDPQVVHKLARGEVDQGEAGLRDLFRKHLGTRIFVSEIQPDVGISQSQVIDITVGTPLEVMGRPDDSGVLDAAEHVAKSTRPGSLVILSSTVPVGTTRRLIYPRLLENPDLKPNLIGLAFCPERMIEGDAVASMRKMPRIVGAINEMSSAAATYFFSKIGFETLLVSDPETAEMAKLLCNAYRATNIGLANEFAILCELNDLSASEVFHAANTSYIVNIMRPGLMGGSCLTKDPLFLIENSRSKGYRPRIVVSAKETNEQAVSAFVNRCVELMVGNGKSLDKANVLVLGVSFKGDTADTRESPARTIRRLLRSRGTQTMLAFDPYVPKEEILKMGFQPVDNVEDGLKRADCVMICSDHSVFRNPKLFENMRSGTILADAKGTLSTRVRNDVIQYGLGWQVKSRGNDSDSI
jgi:UDP-N-acetyl-D-mannosaminuronic acid dehydrogenase